MKSEKVVLQGVGNEIQKSNLIVNPDEFIRIVHLPAAQPRFFEQGIERNPRGLRPGIGEPRYDAASVWKLLDAAITCLRFLSHWKVSIADLGLARSAKVLADDNKTPRKSRPMSPAAWGGTSCTTNLERTMSQEFVIAIVDDDARIRHALEALLTSWGYRVELYDSAEEFIRAAISSAAACLLVDIQLGDISGVELGRHLSASGFIFPIIFMTGSQDELTRRQATDLGCAAYLLKPLKSAELKEAINLAIGKGERI